MITIVSYRPLAIDYEVNAPFANTSSLSFDGVDDYVNCGKISSLNLASQITVSAWVKMSSIDLEIGVIWSSGATNSNDLFRLFKYQGDLTIEINTNSTPSGTRNYGVIPFGSPEGYLNNTWYNITIVFDGTATGNVNRAKAYIDGVLITMTFGDTIPSTLFQNDGLISPKGDFSIGKDLIVFSTFRFNGNIDEVCILDRVATPTEIVTLSTAPTVDLTSLNSIAWYRNGDNGSYKSPQWLIPNNKDKVSNYSMDFDGTDEYLDVGVIPTFQSATNFSISCWLNVPLGANNFFMGSYTSGGDVLYLYVTAAGEIVWNINGVSQRLSGTSNLLSANTWYNVTLVFDGSLGSPNGMLIYINGVVSSGGVSASLPSIMGTMTAPTYIGGMGGLTQRYTGLIDEVAFYDYSLTAAEALAIGGTVPTDLSLLATPPTNYYKMGENATFVYGANPDGTWSVPDEIGTNDGTSNNVMADSARIGDAPNSTNNALSFNMDFVDVVPDTP